MFGDHSNNPDASEKRVYRAPRLVAYGALRDLTQAGGSGTNEGASDCPGKQNQDTTKKIGNACSDQTAKQDIVRIGNHPLGIGLYLFDYKPEFRDRWGHGRQFGVMAQEVETVMPEAVCVHPDGYKTVNYELLGISRSAY